MDFQSKIKILEKKSNHFKISQVETVWSQAEAFPLSKPELLPKKRKSTMGKPMLSKHTSSTKYHIKHIRTPSSQRERN